jgi:hypothetical protein
MNLKVTVRVSSWFLTVWPAHRAAIASALAVSGPAVRGSLPGTPMPLSTRIHVTRDTRLDGDRDHHDDPGPAARLARRRQPGPGYHSPSKIKSLVQAAGMGAGYQGLGATIGNSMRYNIIYNTKQYGLYCTMVVNIVQYN